MGFLGLNQNLYTEKGDIFMERGQSAAPSSLDIKVVRPRRSDNVVQPAGQGSVTPQPRRSFSDYNPFKSWVSWLVPLIVVANIVVFVVTMFVNDCPKNSGRCIGRFLGRFSFQPFKENLFLGPSSNTLEKMGALDAQRVVHQHQGWRLISCMWLHAGVFHVLANMLSLLFIGIRLEQEFGFVRIGILYVMSGFGGSLLSALFIQYGISVGASGALFGLLGSMLSELISNWTMYANKLAALLTLVFIIIINLAAGLLPHVDNFSHIGGFVSGFLFGFVFLIRPQFKWLTQRNAPPGLIATPVKSKHKTYQYVLWVLSLILLIVGMVWRRPCVIAILYVVILIGHSVDSSFYFVVLGCMCWQCLYQYMRAFSDRSHVFDRYTLGLITLFRGVNLNDHCSWCQYMSCIPISKRSCKSQNVYCLSSQIGNQLNLTFSGTLNLNSKILLSPPYQFMLDLSKNHFTRFLPLVVGKFFNGSIPLSMVSSRAIGDLDPSCNNLSVDEIKKKLEGFDLLKNLNLSLNDVWGSTGWRGCAEITPILVRNKRVIFVFCGSSNETDRLALLAFKDQIMEDPHQIMSSWNESIHFCMWRGVTCGRRHRQRVTRLELRGQNLVGSLSPHICNLTFLRILRLQNNSFSHEIPFEIAHLHRLQALYISNNSFTGSIPSNISYCSNLVTLHLGYNRLVGKIPPEIGSLSKLQQLVLQSNNLTEEIPPSLGTVFVAKKCQRLEV
ncbi:hypothetical protein DVH24_038633 [Malus domestica]|uniref:RHOMBOID-like protein n=1 Tax=Malus domestica TaxID=3750 RepID=A0A498K7V8_MALDO|nr:hypothetical protein DVH24_038633 [Malus domestica]